MKTVKIHNNLRVARDGVEAMEMLRACGGPDGPPLPDVILLDLNMPRKDGREVLAEVKTDETLKTIPVMILTTSDAERDVLKSYKLHANCYITKPVDLSQFLTIMKTVEEFWFVIVRLPRAA